MFQFDNSYARLPRSFYAAVMPTPVSQPRLLALNHDLAARLGLDAEWLGTADGVAVLAGNAVPQGAEPLAQAYAGHQFGGFVPQLGDGRAVLLGEITAPDGARFDIQLKGSGQTPFSRRGDGRAWLGPVLREYLVSEFMAAMGVPTTRALAAVATGETVWRESALPGAVLTRVAASHIRVGTFQYFAVRDDRAALQALADHVIARHYPQADSPLALLDAVVAAQAETIAAWMALGFIHGVMNTDNCAVSGETIDYGPCAFMEAYHPETVYSSIDQQGRYAYGNQPGIAHWNLARLAECLLPLIDTDENAAVEKAQGALTTYAARFGAAWRDGLLRKAGLGPAEEGDEELLQDLLVRMAGNKADFTLTFRYLADAADDPAADAAVRALFMDPSAYDAWAPAWRARLMREPGGRGAAMRSVNPLYIPRNHLVEEALAAAASRDDLEPFEALLSVIQRPFEAQPGRDRYAQPARPEEQVLATFCGT